MNTSLNLENTTISSNVCSCFKWCCLNEKERDCAGNYEHNLYTSHLSSQANAESFPHRKKRNHLSHIGSHLHSQCPSTSTSYIRVWYIINTYHTKLSEKRHGTSMGIVAFSVWPRAHWNRLALGHEKELAKPHVTSSASQLSNPSHF